MVAEHAPRRARAPLPVSAVSRPFPPSPGRSDGRERSTADPSVLWKAAGLIFVPGAKKRSHPSGWLLFLAPRAGFEPATLRLTAGCSAVELSRSVGVDLSSRAVARKVLSARTSLTTVFGMGTGGPSPQKTPTHIYIVKGSLLNDLLSKGIW